MLLAVIGSVAAIVLLVLLIRYTTPRCYLDGSRPWCP